MPLLRHGCSALSLNCGRAAIATLLLASSSAGAGVCWSEYEVCLETTGDARRAVNRGPYFLTGTLTLAGTEAPVIFTAKPFSSEVIAGLAPGAQYKAASVLPGMLDPEPQGTRIYSLPYTAGEAYRVSQAHDGKLSTHKGTMQHAIDFVMPERTPVLAARGGLVMDTESKFTEGRLSEDMLRSANFVHVQHSDGTTATYAHLSPGGVAVKRGQQVKEGELLGYSGNTGMSSGPHLHFAVFAPRLEGGKLVQVSLPVRFRVGPNDEAVAPAQLAMLTAWAGGQVSPDTVIKQPTSAAYTDLSGAPLSSDVSAATVPVDTAGLPPVTSTVDAILADIRAKQAEAKAREARAELSLATGASGPASTTAATPEAGATAYSGKLIVVISLVLFWRYSRRARAPKAGHGYA